MSYNPRDKTNINKESKYKNNMIEKSKVTKTSNFYKNFRETNPALVLGLIFITIGFYIIHWLYVKNKDFEEIDQDAPDSTRGAIILMILPFMWFFIIFIFKKIFGHENLYLQISEIVGYGIIIFLILKYLFDFCISFGKITKTNGLFWYLSFFFPILGIVLSFFDFYYLLPLVFFLIIVVPAMQAELNSYIQKFQIKKESNLFYN